MAREKFVQIENKNAILELINEGKEFEKIYIANNAYRDPKTSEILKLARANDITVEDVTRRVISRRSRTSSKESVIGLMKIENMYRLSDLLDEIFERNDEPFFLIFNEIKYSQNIGAIFRSAFAAGVNGVIVPIQKTNLLSDEVVRISMGTCLRIPIVEMNLFAAVKELKKNAVGIVGLDMDGENMYETDLTGSNAFLLGSEYMGITSKMEENAEKIISIPMKKGLGSLNVSVASALVVYEKFRQESFNNKLKT